jgi:hypothetical protein
VVAVLAAGAVCLLGGCGWGSGGSDDIDGVVYAGNGHTFKLFNQKMNWTGAKNYCEGRGGYLATITDAGEQVFIEELLTNYGDKNMYWLGGYTTGGFVYQWVTGEPFVYTNWDNGSSTLTRRVEDKLMIYRVVDSRFNCHFGEWTDDTDDAQDAFYKNNGFICEWE